MHSKRKLSTVPTSFASRITTYLNLNFLLLLGLILLFAAFWRLYRLDSPKNYIFDEVYHSVTAKLIARNDVRAYEWWNEPIEPNTAVDWLHPPLAKYTQALSMLIFGENPFGWRFSAAVFGVLTVATTAKLSLLLFKNKPLSLLAALLVALDGLMLVQSRIAMNDIHVTFFVSLTLIVYIKYRQRLMSLSTTPHRIMDSFNWLSLAGLCAGLAMGTKWSGIFVLFAIWLFEGVRVLTPLLLNHSSELSAGERFKRFFSQVLSRIGPLLVLPFLVYVLSYSHMFLQGKTLVCLGDKVIQGQCYGRQDSSWWVELLKKINPSKSVYWESLEARGGHKRLISHFSELHHQIWWYQSTLKATHPFQSKPYQWFLNLRPVWMHITTHSENMVSNIYSVGNSMLFWTADFAVLLTIVIIITNLFLGHANDFKLSSTEVMLEAKRSSTPKIFSDTLNPMFFLLTSYFIMWLPWQLSPRIMFFNHYAPAVPLLCIFLAYWLHRLWSYVPEDLTLEELKAYESRFTLSQALVMIVLGLILINFFLWLPHWTNVPMDRKFVDAIYFALPSWK